MRSKPTVKEHFEASGLASVRVAGPMQLIRTSMAEQ
jgi:hypothetical protein